MGLTKASIQRPIFVLMLLLAAVLMGWLSYKSMRVEQNPEVSFGVVTIQTVYPGANPETINTLVSRKLEEAVSGVNGVREVTSTSQTGISIVVVQLELGVNTDNALNDVRTKVDSIINTLPDDIDKPQITKQDTSATPVMYLAFSADKLKSRELRDLLDEKLSDRFAQLPGVASAFVQGGDVREIQVQVKKDKLLSYGIGIVDVQRAIAGANVDIPGGKLRTSEQEFSVRVLNQFSDPKQLEDLIFTVSDPSNPQGKKRSVKLSDVATVLDTQEERTRYTRLNGQDTIVVVIQKTREGNAVEISDAAKGVLKAIDKEYADIGLKAEITQDESIRIRESIEDLNIALAFGIFLVTIIVYVFLHNFRGTLIVALAIPTCIMATFIAMKAAGFTINNLSMLALSLAVGVLVDDAIVVLENIYRHLKMGEPPIEAAINGRAEIGLAAIAITLADVVVFLPIANLSGIVGQFFKPLALGFVIAVLFSLFVSFTLTPMLASRWYRQGEDMEHPTGRFAVWFERQFAKLENFYRRALEWALQHRWFVFIFGNLALVCTIFFVNGTKALAGSISLIVVALVIGLIVTIINLVRLKKFSLKYLGAALAFGALFPLSCVAGDLYWQWKKEAVFKFSFLPDSDAGQVEAKIELPPGTSLEKTEAVVRQIEKIFMADPDIEYVLSDVGSQSAGQFSTGNSGTNYARVQGTLYEKKAIMDSFGMGPKGHHLRTRSDKAIAGELLAQVGRVPGARVTISATSAFGFGQPIQMSFASDDREKLLATVQTIRNGLQNGAVKGVISPDISSKPGKPELRFEPNSRSIADAGVTVADVGTAVRTLYNGNDDSKLRVLGREYNIRVMMDLADRDEPNLVGQVPVSFIQGNPVYLGSLGTVTQAPGVDKIQRRNRAEEVQVTADLLPGFVAGSAQADIDAWLTKEKLVPEGIRYKPLGQADSQARESGALVGAFFLGLLLVYMLLASLYDNLVYPFIIQLSQPQAMVGAILALVITNKAFSLIGFIGLLTLVGLVGKNAILLVDYTNTLRERGRNRHDALVEAGPVRLRPIMMTTLALVVGTLPTALAIGRGSEFRETLGIIIIGGIALSTFLTLLVIPCSYTIFDDLSNWFGRIRGKGKAATPKASSTEGSTEDLAPSVG
jgi:HAE1 family hydrophobic/amphiphilic exporter-1